jgi:precorrin-2 methylase
MSPSLVIVGSGIQSGRDMTRAALEEIRRADKVLYLVTELITATWLHELNPSAEPLHVFYGINKPRRDTYAEMAEHILSFLRAGRNVCVVSYGHPGIFADPMHEALRRARSEKYPAVMLPGISAIDWLYADLGLDPATNGCQIFDATDFLEHRRRHDTESALILLQVGIIGEKTLPQKCNTETFRELTQYLSREYGPDHEIVIYEASRYSIANPVIQRAALKRPSAVTLSLASTMYVPAKGEMFYQTRERK